MSEYGQGALMIGQIAGSFGFAIFAAIPMLYAGRQTKRGAYREATRTRMVALILQGVLSLMGSVDGNGEFYVDPAPIGAAILIAAWALVAEIRQSRRKKRAI